MFDRMQVTALGGLEAVIGAKKWTEVSQPFQFPPSFTSKSFTLRKMYSRLLHDYEQVYFHRNQGIPTLPPGARHTLNPRNPARAHAPALLALAVHAPTCSMSGWQLAALRHAGKQCQHAEPSSACSGADGTKLEGGAAMTSSNPAYKRRRVDLPAAGQLPLPSGGSLPGQLLPAMPSTPPALSAFPAGAALRIPAGSLLGQPLTGSVDMQFDAGYFVTLHVAGNEFKGAGPPALVTFAFTQWVLCARMLRRS